MNNIGLDSSRDHKWWAAALFAGVFLTALALVLMAGPARAVPGECDLDCPPPPSNTPPTVAANNATVNVSEGQTANNIGTYSDDDGDQVTLSASSGTVTRDSSGSGTWSWSFPTADGPDQNRTVTITASDGTDSAATTFSLTVNNVAPTVTPPNNSNDALEFPYVYYYDFSVSDPGNDTWSIQATSCGSNGRHVEPSTALPGWGLITVGCEFLDGPGSSTVSASAVDSDGAASNTASKTVSVQNGNPTAILNAPASINEGAPATVSFTYQDDGVADTNAGFHYAVDCNGGSLGTATYANSGAVASTTCTYNDNGAKTIRARIIDKDGGFTEYTKAITVNNAAPTATFNSPASVNQGNNFTISLTSVFDPSTADTLAYAFDCDNGSGYVSSPDPSKVCSARDKPTMTVKGKVTDDDGGVYEDQKTVTVNNVNPTGTVQINNNAATTNNATVNLTLSATDPLPGSGVGHMRFRNENTETWSEWEPYQTSRQWQLSSGDGTKTVFVEYKDNAGNVSQGTISDQVVLDTTTPTDTTAPKVQDWTPKRTGTARSRPTVIFSEQMNVASVEATNASGLPTTFTLKKGTRSVAATVAYVETLTGQYKAILTPNSRLRSGVTYTATLTIDAKDAAGNALDQDPNTAGDQAKVWKFRVK